MPAGRTGWRKLQPLLQLATQPVQISSAPATRASRQPQTATASRGTAVGRPVEAQTAGAAPETSWLTANCKRARSTSPSQTKAMHERWQARYRRDAGPKWPAREQADRKQQASGERATHYIAGDGTPQGHIVVGHDAGGRAKLAPGIWG